MYNRNSNSSGNTGQKVASAGSGMYGQPPHPHSQPQRSVPQHQQQSNQPQQSFTTSPFTPAQGPSAQQAGGYGGQFQYNASQDQQPSGSMYQGSTSGTGTGTGAFGYGQSGAQQGNYGYYGQTQTQSSFGGGANMGGNAMGNAQEFNQFAGQFVPENVLENPMMQVGLAQTQKAMGETMEKLAPGMTGVWGTLKFYFAVDGNYVLNKLKLILFPFRHKQWKRQGTAGDASDKFAPPILDVNCPDLYIPLMAILTHTLVLSLLKGQYMKFTPEVISDTLSSSLLALFLECIAIIGGNWTLQSKGGVYSYMEVAIFSSYKYVGVAINMLVGLFLGFTGFVAVTVYTSLASAYFLCKSLASKMPIPIAKRTRLFLAVLAVLDFLIVVYLSYSSEFGKESVEQLPSLSSEAVSTPTESANLRD